jgi:hypothetical protein
MSTGTGIRDYTALADAGKTLINVIWNDLKDDAEIRKILSSIDQITLNPPTMKGTDDCQKISIFLYQINESPFTRNLLPPKFTKQNPAIYLTLNYLVSVNTGKAEDDQILIGRILKAIVDNPIVRKYSLQGNLPGDIDELHVAFNPIPIDQLVGLWNALSLPYRLVVSCSVYSIKIAPTNKTGEVPVIEKIVNYSQKLKENGTEYEPTL